jgi:hypothetical protein
MFMTKIGQVLIAVVFMLPLSGCGGTWVDDESNFKRIFGFDKPNDVQILHSYYWKSPHWSTEYQYYIALRSSNSFTSGLTAAQLMSPAVPDKDALARCGGNLPPWFVSKPLSHYQMWIAKSSARYRVFRDQDDNTLYVCDELL